MCKLLSVALVIYGISVQMFGTRIDEVLFMFIGYRFIFADPKVFLRFPQSFPLPVQARHGKLFFVTQKSCRKSVWDVCPTD